MKRLFVLALSVSMAGCLGPFHHHNLFVYATCKNASQDLRTIEITDLTTGEADYLATQVEQSLCAGAIYKLHPRKDYWQ